MAKKSKATNGNGKNGAPEETKATPKLTAGKKQIEIPGTERPAIAELDELIAPFVQARYERMAQFKLETELHAEVLAAMKRLKRPLYVYQDGEERYTLEVTEATERVKVQRVNEADAQ